MDRGRENWFGTVGSWRPWMRFVCGESMPAPSWSPKCIWRGAPVDEPLLLL